MSMQVSTVGNYGTSFATANGGVSGLSQPTVAATGGSAGGYGYDQYQPAPAGYQGQGGGMSIGRAAAWGGGIFAALKWLRPVFSTPSGWVTLGIGLGGWLVGEKVYQFITGRR